MARKAMITPGEVVESWGLDYYTGNAINALFESVTAQDSTSEMKALEKAAENLTRKVELTKQAKLRGAWKKAKNKQRKAPHSENKAKPSEGA